MSLLIFGSTGTLGRQIVLTALTKGYKVRCAVRNFRKAMFLKNWGVELVYVDFNKPETIPACLKGITAIIDASASRPNDIESLQKVEWEGKIFLLKAAKIAKIKKFIFFSTHNVEYCTNIPFLKLKYEIELQLKTSQISYTIFQLTGFYQGLIEQYAIPILENLPILITEEPIQNGYMDTQDIAKFCLRSLQLKKTQNQTFLLTSLKQWVCKEIVTICSQLIGQPAKVIYIPTLSVELVSNFFDFFEWSESISDRLALIKIYNNKMNFDFKIYNLFDTYRIFKIDPLELVQLDIYFLEYFKRLLKRLRDINFEDVQKQKTLII